MTRYVVREARPEELAIVIRHRRRMIVNMFTEPEHRRQGLARRLLEEMVAWCRCESYSLVSLHASAEGRSVYTTMGFRPSNEMRLALEAVHD